MPRECYIQHLRQHGGVEEVIYIQKAEGSPHSGYDNAVARSYVGGSINCKHKFGMATPVDFYRLLAHCQLCGCSVSLKQLSFSL